MQIICQCISHLIVIKALMAMVQVVVRAQKSFPVEKIREKKTLGQISKNRENIIITYLLNIDIRDHNKSNNVIDDQFFFIM